MPRSTQHKSKGNADQRMLLSVPDAIENWLRKMLTLFPQKELTPGEIDDWIRDLKGFPLSAIDYAFENWRRNGRWFPVYGDILDMCIAWAPEPEYKPGCSKECLPRHGKGYHSNDMLWLWNRYTKLKDTLPNRPMTDGEVNGLLDELDKHRGSKPAWRQ